LSFYFQTKKKKNVYNKEMESLYEGDRCPRNQTLYEDWLQYYNENSEDIESTKRRAENEHYKLYRSHRSQHEIDCVERAWRKVLNSIYGKGNYDPELENLGKYAKPTAASVKRIEKSNFRYNTLSSAENNTRRTINSILSIQDKTIHPRLLFIELTRLLEPFAELAQEEIPVELYKTDEWESEGPEGRAVVIKRLLRKLKTFFAPHTPMKIKNIKHIIPDSYEDPMEVVENLNKTLGAIEGAITQRLVDNKLRFGKRRKTHAVHFY
jgi:hypothetical protein